MHSLLHWSSAQSLCFEKRRPVLGSGWPGTRQVGQSTNSQKSSPGASAMLWSPGEPVTRWSRLRRASLEVGLRGRVGSEARRGGAWEGLSLSQVTRQQGYLGVDAQSLLENAGSRSSVLL